MGSGIDVRGYTSKVQENLDCADLAYREQWSNAAASRYYYAAFIVTLAYFLKTGDEPPVVDEKRGSRRWNHTNIGRKLRESGLASLAKTLASLREIREMADYRSTDVGVHRLVDVPSQTRQYVNAFLERMDAL